MEGDRGVAYQQGRTRPLSAVRHVLWRDPGDVAARDLRHGPGGTDFTPAPPFTFIEEHASGSQPCVSVRDGRGRRWRVKWGDEVRSETFTVRFVWAVGYFAEITHFVAEGTIAEAKDLQRARACIDDQCRFVDARFEIDDPEVKKLFEEHGWAWNDNPFLGTRELQGLKILVMLLSNWDSKDRRDVARGSNTAIFEYRLPGGVREARYLITDWGGSMGRWGSNIVTRGRWDPAGLRGADAGVRALGRRRHRALRLRRTADRRRRDRHHRRGRALALPVSRRASPTRSSSTLCGQAAPPTKKRHGSAPRYATASSNSNMRRHRDSIDSKTTIYELRTKNDLVECLGIFRVR